MNTALPGNQTDDSFNFFNNIINDLNDESILTLAELLSIPKNNIALIKSGIKNIIASQINLNDPQIQNDFLEIIKNLNIIQNQIIPQAIVNYQFISKRFYIAQKNDQEPNDVFLQVSAKEETIFLQLIPDGLSILPDFSILENEKQIEIDHLYHNSYIKLQNKEEKIKLTFINSPQNLFFFQILIFQKKTNDELFQYFRSKLNIPKEVSDIEARIFHMNHSFELIQLIESVQQNDAIICPICKEKTELIFFDCDTNEQILDYILEDNETELINSMLVFEKDHVFTSKFQLPIILRNQPSFLSLCAFFNAKKCFFSLLNFYLERKDYSKINQKDQQQRSPIHFACFGGDLSIVKALIENNEILDSNDCKRYKPIHYAAMGGKIEIIKYMYENELNMFECDNDESKTPLHLACQFGYLGIVKFYCQIIIPCSKISNLFGFLSHFCTNKITPLHDACKGDKIEIVNYLLSFEDFAEKQIDMNPDKTPLLYACEFGSLDCVKALLNSENIVFEEQQIVKSFNAAILNGHIDVLSFMLKKLSIKISFIMIFAAVAKNLFECAKFLIENAFSSNETFFDIIESLNKPMNSISENEQHSTIELIDNHDESQSELQSNESSNSNNMNDISTSLNHLPIPFISSSNQTQQIQPIQQNQLNQQTNQIQPILQNQSYQQTQQNQFLINIHQIQPVQRIQQTQQIHQTQQNQPVQQIQSNQQTQQNQTIQQNQSNHQTQQNQFSISIPQNQQNQSVQQNQFSINSQNQIAQMRADPTSPNYFNNSLTLADLSKFVFPSKNKVKIAVQNVSVAQKKYVRITKSESNRIIFKCIEECSFSMTWKERNGHWLVPDGCFKDHSCTEANTKKPMFHYNIIDNAISSLPLANLDIDKKLKVLCDFFGENAKRRTIKRRLLNK